MFLRNCWYVAAWSKDVGRELKAETFLGENIVLYRQLDGTPVALEDACPHRKLPLSKGNLIGDVVECGYHGLKFDCSGKCTDSPTQRGMTPRRAVVKSYPVVDRYRYLWIWMGDPALADPDKIFPIENFDDPSWGKTDGGVMDIDCHYLWVCDNLLDPSHVAWVHVTSFAGAGTDEEPLDVEKTDRGVIVSRWIENKPPSPYYANLVAFEGDCDRLQHYEMCLPAIALNKSVYTPVGTGGYGKPPVDKTYVNISYNFMTPIDEDRTRYFWFQHRNTDPDNAEVSKFMNDGARMAFLEDKEVLEEVHLGMKHAKTPHIDLGLDKGAKLFRKALDTAIEAETASADIAVQA
ncbi:MULTISPECIES: aromatic ring-hydroxylating dioxygenase subunit alpha [unclassified Ruegeria]|uniref:aromatic ring-hydroxylating dioxygenase subunit alpha n=1 Tax=unclassified Ruegeria TaxID=2625375 RepID=UPI0014876B11|nr:MULTISPECIES: aromatic ring-hydroxylating dioxygenase subunit alpha [unclassified Ruegeria]NOD88497.1 Rieske 2Fe-2S domain-containing protein [Ruegeria sp. HKCCD4318]NOE13406.1 Rieske 2Fe-2S domain-containing protein [Ruegeria sp. HKCCD4318-2]NOG11052.1 aromatic ring-hydroxylating dioxygenase subunit alpha [Ruegeria sp. HKCCD4315]